LNRLRGCAFAAFAAALLPCPCALAGSPSGEFALKGPGYDKCSDFASARKQRGNKYHEYVGWLEGYLSYYNRVTPGTINIAPWQSGEMLASLMAAFCADNPNAPFVAATDLMIGALAPYRLAKSSEVVEASYRGRKVTVYREVLRSVQESLQKRKLYAGPQDGQFSSEFAASLLAFQKSTKLPPTGLPDQATLYHLLLKR
jgi:hypothetical protein